MVLISERARAGVEESRPRPGRSGRTAGSARVRRWSWTSIRCWPAARSCAVQARGSAVESYVGRVDASHGSRSLRRTPSSGVGRGAFSGRSRRCGGDPSRGRDPPASTTRSSTEPSRLGCLQAPRRARLARSRPTSSRTAGAISVPNSLHRARVVTGDDERAHPVRRRPARPAARPTAGSVDGARRCRAAGSPRAPAPRPRGVVDAAVLLGQLLRRHVRLRGQPAVPRRGRSGSASSVRSHRSRSRRRAAGAGPGWTPRAR